MKNAQKTTDTEETHGTVNETDKPKSNSDQLLEKIEIENTPFTAIKVEDKWFLMMGKYRLTEALTKDEVLAASLDESWFRIMQVIKIMIEDHDKEKTTNN